MFTLTGGWRYAARRTLIAGTAVLAVLGVPFALLAGEPYPWLMMPRFPGTGGFEDGRVVVTSAEFEFRFADTPDATILPPSAVFFDVPSSNYGRLASRFSREPRSVPRRVQKVRALLGLGLDPGGDVLRPDDPRVRSWLVARSRLLFPGRELERVDVVWRRRTFGVDGTVRDDRVVGQPLGFTP